MSKKNVGAQIEVLIRKFPLYLVGILFIIIGISVGISTDSLNGYQDQAVYDGLSSGLIIAGAIFMSIDKLIIELKNNIEINKI